MMKKERLYRRLGITHLFAISGLHVGLLTFMLRELLLRIKIRRETVEYITYLFLPIYAILAGVHLLFGERFQLLLLS